MLFLHYFTIVYFSLLSLLLFPPLSFIYSHSPTDHAVVVELLVGDTLATANKPFKYSAAPVGPSASTATPGPKIYVSADSTYVDSKAGEDGVGVCAVGYELPMTKTLQERAKMRALVKLREVGGSNYGRRE